MMCGLAGICLAMAAIVSRRPAWRPFHESFLVTGVLLAPVTAIAGLTLGGQPHFPAGMGFQTLMGLGALYALAAWALRTRKLLALALICAAASFII
jgi:hypothetical protein